MSRTQKAEYALYRGDEFIMVGTIREIAEKQHVKENTIRFYASPCYRKTTKGKGYILIKVDDDENYDDWKKCSFKHYLLFDLERNTFDAHSRDYLNCIEDYPKSINAIELMAINQQCKELGWLEWS